MGSDVDVIYEDGGIRLRLRGTAANAAPLGGRVIVRVDRRRLEGTATAPGVVRVR
jgi:flagella basal body P-ring formation protein FlgA